MSDFIVFIFIVLCGFLYMLFGSRGKGLKRGKFLAEQSEFGKTMADFSDLFRSFSQSDSPAAHMAISMDETRDYLEIMKIKDEDFLLLYPLDTERQRHYRYSIASVCKGHGLKPKIIEKQGALVCELKNADRAEKVAIDCFKRVFEAEEQAEFLFQTNFRDSV